MPPFAPGAPLPSMPAGVSDWRAGEHPQALPPHPGLATGINEHGFHAADNFIDPSWPVHLNERAPPAMPPVGALAGAAPPTEWTADQLLPPKIETRPLRLEQAIHDAIAEHGFRGDTVHALNRAFGLELWSPPAHWDPAQEEHKALMERLKSSSNLSSLELSLARKFLVLLERKGMSFTEDASDSDRQGFERMVNQHGDLGRNRHTLNKIFDLKLKAPAYDTAQPTLQEHLELMEGLREKLPQHLHKPASKFFCHLEQQNTSWSAVMAKGEIQQAADEALDQGQIEPATYRALNRGFGLALTGPRLCTQRPTSQEHLGLLRALPADLNQTYRSRIVALLGHLELKGKRWRELVPNQNSPVQLQLEEFVNDAMARGQLQPETRAALNSGFSFSLQGRSGRKKVFPMLPEHRCLMARLPHDLPQSICGIVARLLCHLEVIGTSWSALVNDEPADQGPAG
jgi:hypothetical protein